MTQQPSLPLFGDDQPNTNPASEDLETKKNLDFETDKSFGLNLLALGHIRGVGINTIKVLLKAYNNLSYVWDDDESAIVEYLKKARAKEPEQAANIIKTQKAKLLDQAQAELMQLEFDDVHIISSNSAKFPKQLISISSAPDWLFVQGNVSALREPLIGIVGTRHPTKMAEKTATHLANIVASEGFGIVSGLAEGIDNFAHRMGLNYGVPQVAVLGTGIDVYYPLTTKKTRLELISKGGAVVTEYLPGSAASKSQFVERNRIQAGLATALAPIESQIQSGTAHTVDFAEKYKRPIFAVSYGPPAKENELVPYLVDRKKKYFDIENPNDVSLLRNWLRDLVKSDNLPKQSYSIDRSNVFGPLLKQLDNLIRLVPLSEEDAKWLEQQVQQRLGRSTSGDTTNGG